MWHAVTDEDFNRDGLVSMIRMLLFRRRSKLLRLRYSDRVNTYYTVAESVAASLVYRALIHYVATGA